MKKILLLLLLAIPALAGAQIIQSSALTVENSYEKIALPKGYKGFVEAGIGLDVVGGKPVYTITTSHGILFQSGLYLGLGSGLTSYESYNFYRTWALPVFADARWYFGSLPRLRLFGGLKAGYNISLKEKGSSGYSQKLSGLYISPGFGIEYGKLTLSFNYLVQAVKWHDPWGDSTDYDNSTLMLRIGVNF